MPLYQPKYFTLPELCSSERAKALGIANVPDFDDIPKLLFLCEHVLDPLREACGKPLKITSSFRTPALNNAIGGAKNSQHMCTGQEAAADIDAGSNEDNKALFEIARTTLSFTQLIDERNYAWVHIGISLLPGGNKRQILHL